MEENVKEKEEVVVDETTNVENNVEETVNTEVLEEASETKDGFDANAFVEASSFLDDQKDKPETDKAEGETVSEKENTDDGFVWDYPTAEKTESTPKEPVADTVETNTFNWEDTGLEGVKSKEDFEAKINEFKEYEKKVKEYETKNIKSDKITKLRDFISMEDRALVEADLKMQGFKDEKLEDALSTYEVNGNMNIEAQKIRNTLNKAIRNEEQNELNQVREQEARLQKEREDSMAELKNHLEKTETMFGFKMAKDSDGMKKVREDHYDYITSGTFLNSIMESNQNVTEAAWLWKNKDTILNAMKNQGYQRGKKEILDNIQRPEIPGTNRILDPTGKTDEFNPNAFLFGQ